MIKKTVFISYSHDSGAHRERVLALSERLRADSIETLLDRYLNGSPQQGWPVAPDALETPLLHSGLPDPRCCKAIEHFVAPIPSRTAPRDRGDDGLLGAVEPPRHPWRAIPCRPRGRLAARPTQFRGVS